MRHFHKRYYDVGCLILMMCVVFCGVFLSSNFVSADESYNADVSLTIPVACTMTGTVDTPHTANVDAGTYVADIGTTTLKTVCNDGNGFSIYAIGYSGLEYGNNKMLATVGETLAPTYDIVTGTAQNGNTSNWAMKLNTVTGTYAPSIITGFDSYHAVPDTYTKVATRTSGTDATTGASIQSTYAVYVTSLQPAGSYNGKVRYTLIHPNDADEPATPQDCYPGYICYFSNVGDSEGTMGRQAASDGDAAKLFASNFSREGYGFAGWSDAFDYAYNSEAHFYGPNEDITVPEGTTANGLALYAVWIKSAGTMQANTATVCDSLTAATYNDEGDSDESTWSITASLNSISALTDTRDNQTYAIAKLTDGRCWMIENLRLADTHTENNVAVPTTLTAANTNNPSLPLTNVYDTGATSNQLSPTSNVVYDATTAPEGWCSSNIADCYNQSRLRTDNTTSRASYTVTQTMLPYANLYSYGNYYNWYSATAGNGTYGKSSGNVVGDLCPSGWHLPSGNDISATIPSEFGLLSNSLGGYKDASNVAQTMDSSTTPSSSIMLKRIRHFPNNYLYSGSVYNASLYNRGDSGVYWASNAYSFHYAISLAFDSSSFNPGIYQYYKYYGRVVRCTANSS